MLHLTAHNFKSETYFSDFPVVVMFYANWCPKCSMMKPVIEALEQKYCSQITFCKVDIEESPSLAKTFEADTIPTFVFFKNRRLEAVFSGIVDENTFEQRIQKIFRNC